MRGAAFEVCNGQDLASNPAASVGVLLTAVGTANTKTAWTQIIAATAVDINFLVFGARDQNASLGTNFSLDIGIGGAGSEVVKIADLVFSTGNQNGHWRMAVPCHIPAGSRLAVRSQCSRSSSDELYFNMQGFSGQGIPSAGIDTLGFVAASTTGVQITPGGSSNTMGSFAQIVAATARDYVGIFAAFEIKNFPSKDQLFDIAIGGSGSEIVIVPNLYIRTDGGCLLGFYPFVPIPIPAGSRLSARTQASSGTTTAGLVLYGVY